MNRISPARSNSGLVVVGIGLFGFRVLDALRRCQEQHPARPAPPVLWGGPGGWVSSKDLPDAPGDISAALASGWMECHEEEGATLLRKMLYSGVPSGRPGVRNILATDGVFQPGIVLVAHLQESFGQALWRPVLRLIRQILHPLSQSTITLILAVDSLVLASLPPEEGQSLHTALEALAEELADSLASQPGFVDWCYLVDVVDVQACPLQAIWLGGANEQGWEQGDPVAVQAHQAAEMIQILHEGLLAAPAYRRTSRSARLAENRGEQRTASIGAFAAGRLVFPQPGLDQCFIDQMAGQILREGIMGSEKPSDVLRAIEMRRAWFADCRLPQYEMLEQIQQDGSGQRLVYTLRPPDLRKVKAKDLVTYVRYWDDLLEKRWQDAGSLRVIFANNATRQVNNAGAWLDLHLQEILQRQPGGARLALLFLTQAEKALESEMEAPWPVDQPRPGWQKRLAALLLDAARRLFRLANPDNLESALETLDETTRARSSYKDWLLRSIKANWKSFPYSLGIFLAVVLVMLLLLGPFLLPVFAMICVALLVFSGIKTFARPVFSILCNELRLHDALEQAVFAIQQKYRQRVQDAIADEKRKAYAALANRLSQWRELVSTRDAVLQKVGEHFRGKENDHFRPALRTEMIFPLKAELGWREDLLSASRMRKLAGEFMQSFRQGDWREEIPEELSASLRKFCSHSLARVILPVDFDIRLENAYKDRLPGTEEQPDEAWQKHLLSQLRPAFPLTAEEQAGMVAVLNTSRGKNQGSMHMFVGMPGKGHIPRAGSGPQPEQIHSFSSQDADSLVAVKIIQGLSLLEQKIFTEWTRAGQWQ